MKGLTSWNGPVVLVLVVLLAGGVREPARAELPRNGTVARGMANAVVAGSGNPAASLFNPALSATISGNQVLSDLSDRRFGDDLSVREGLIGSVHPSTHSTHSFFLSREQLDFQFDNFTNTAPGLKLDVTENLLTYNYSRRVRQGLFLGLNANAIRLQSSVNDGSAQGWGLDLGALVRPERDWSMGLSLQNIAGQRDWATETTESLTRTVQGGLRYSFHRNGRLEVGAIHRDDLGLSSINAGVEWQIPLSRRSNPVSTSREYKRHGSGKQKSLAFRLGLEQERNGPEDLFLSMGGSFRVNRMNLHYAYHEQRNGEFGHSFGAGYYFDGY